MKGAWLSLAKLEPCTSNPSGHIIHNCIQYVSIFHHDFSIVALGPSPQPGGAWIDILIFFFRSYSTMLWYDLHGT